MNGEKVSKESVDYRKQSALDVATGRRCGTCTMFRSGGTCTLVLGKIAPDMICDEFDPK